METSNLPFEAFVGLNEFKAMYGLVGSLTVAKMPKGKIMVLCDGKVVASIKDELKGITAKETVAKLKGVHTVFAIPKDKNSLALLMESKSKLLEEELLY